MQPFNLVTMQRSYAISAVYIQNPCLSVFIRGFSLIVPDLRKLLTF